MLKRLLLAVALPVLAAAPVKAQTTFLASGGSVVFTPDGMGFTPFQLFVDIAGLAERSILSSDGTSVTLDTRGSVGVSGFPSLGSLNLGSFSAGTSIFFRYVVKGDSYNTTDFYRQIPDGFNLDYADLNNGGGDRLRFSISGIASGSNLQCPGGDRLAVCTTLTPVTSTPEPGTWALMATGLAGLVPVVRRRRANV